MKEKEAAERALEEKMDRWVYLNDLAERDPIEKVTENQVFSVFFFRDTSLLHRGHYVKSVL